MSIKSLPAVYIFLLAAFLASVLPPRHGPSAYSLPQSSILLTMPRPSSGPTASTSSNAERSFLNTNTSTSAQNSESTTSLAATKGQISLEHSIDPASHQEHNSTNKLSSSRGSVGSQSNASSNAHRRFEQLLRIKQWLRCEQHPSLAQIGNLFPEEVHGEFEGGGTMEAEEDVKHTTSLDEMPRGTPEFEDSTPMERFLAEPQASLINVHGSVRKSRL